MTLHDHYLPNFQFAEEHRVLVHATPEQIYPHVRHLDVSSSRVVRILSMLRGMPARMMKLEGLTREKFVLLEEHVNEELIIGLIGQMWKPTGNLQDFKPQQFKNFDGPFAKATWNFKLTPSSEGTWITTETRIYCRDENVRKKFARYWFIIRPFSGWIRKEMLRVIQKRAEAMRP